MADPLPVCGKRQRALRVRVAAERAVQRHQAVAEQAVPQVAARSADAGGGGMAAHAGRQRHRLPAVGTTREAVAADPVLVEQKAVAQVGDAGAAHLAQPGKRCRVGCGAQHDVDPVAGAFERRAVVRRAQADQIVHPRRPGVAGHRAAVQRAAQQQASHAVAEQHQPLDRLRPGRHQQFELSGQRMAVDRHMQAAVVAQVDR